MGTRRCAACGTSYRPRPQAPHQSFCTRPACQRERRRRWQKAKRAHDPDYRENQEKAQKAWCARNPDYWRDYRMANLDYRDRNRAQQRARNRADIHAAVAKMDVSAASASLPPGIYRITPAPASGIAKMDSWTVEITLLARASSDLCGRCKERM